MRFYIRVYHYNLMKLEDEKSMRFFIRVYHYSLVELENEKT
jgi:hypothetical protein